MAGLAARPRQAGGWALQAILRGTFALLERSRQRHALSRLDARLLKDIGLTREQVGHETDKWFLQA